MHLIRTFVAASVLLCASVAGRAQATDLHSVAWLRGIWQTTTRNGVTTERWTASTGTMMVGLSNTERNGTNSSVEILRIELRAGYIVYIATLAKTKKVAEFKLVEATPTRLVFEGGDEHVQRIIYESDGPDKLTARIEGKQGSKPFSEEFHYVRSPPATR